MCDKRTYLAHTVQDSSRCRTTTPLRRRVRRQYGILLGARPDTRLLVPDAETCHLAGMIAGTLTRTQGFRPPQRKECLNDVLIYLTAAKRGLPVATATRTEFDLIQQIAPGGTFLHF